MPNTTVHQNVQQQLLELSQCTKSRADCGQFWKETNHLNFQFHLFSQTGKDCEKKIKKKLKGGRRGHISSHELISVSVRVLPNSSFLHAPQTSCQTGAKFQIVNQREFFQRQSPEYDLSKSCSHTNARNHSFSLCPHGRQKV